MNNHGNPITILYAEDDEEDQMLAREALEESKLANEMRFVSDGVELLDYLHNRGQFANKNEFPRPGLILLDLNMPRKDGRQALKEIKEDPVLRRIPVVVLTTSKADEDILRTYDLGIAGFIQKTVSFDDFVMVVKVIGKYWFQIVELPLDGERV